MTDALLSLSADPSAGSACFERVSSRTHTQAGAPGTIADLCKAYDWPSGLGGGGRIALVELGGGYAEADIDAYFEQAGLPRPHIAHVSMDGARNTPNVQRGADIEVTMDIEVAGAAYALATGKPAEIVVYWAPNQPGSSARAMRQAIADRCAVFSLAWGANEASWQGWNTPVINYLDDMEMAVQEALAAGMLVFAAASPAAVDMPAACPGVIACGGASKTSALETVWSAAPGPSSSPDSLWQKFAPQPDPSQPLRPDPHPGYRLFVHGQPEVFDGACAVAPLLGGLFAAFGSRLGETPVQDPGAGQKTCFDPARAFDLGRFVAAAYEMYEADRSQLHPAPGPGFPKGYRMAGWVHLRDQGAPRFCGFLAQAEGLPEQFVMALRGTQTPEEGWDTLVSAHKVPFPAPDGGWVALGIERLYRSLEIVACQPAGAFAPISGGFARQLAALTRQLAQPDAAMAHVLSPRPPEVVVVGHGLGGALATLYAVDNAHDERLANPLLCTFASPRVGDAGFVAAFEALRLTSWRVVNAPDVVPMLPPESAGFGHVGRAVPLDCGARAPADLRYWHSLHTYLQLLDPGPGSTTPEPCAEATGLFFRAE